jgi:peptidoglycan/xylan/chitin deacetylase (PgdA/CDA1 family)
VFLYPERGMKEPMSTREVLAPGPGLLYPLKAAATSARSTLWLLRTRGALPDGGVRFLFYHRVSPDVDELAVSPQRFAKQMAMLADHGFGVLDVVDATRRLFTAGRSPQRLVALSFDDGYRDVADYALPVLERHGFRATVFVATGLIDGTAPLTWYDGSAPPLLTWDEIRSLDRSGTLRFEAHSLTHRNLVALDATEARAEIGGSKHVLEAHLQRPVHAFCYPGGLLTDRDRALARAAGYELAVSCEPGRNDAASDRFSLCRLQIDHRDTLLDFRAKLGGGHDSPPPGRALYRRLRYGAPTPARESSLAYRPR